MNANKTRELAAARKREMIYGSNTGLPGTQVGPETFARTTASVARLGDRVSCTAKSALESFLGGITVVGGMQRR